MVKATEGSVPRDTPSKRPRPLCTSRRFLRGRLGYKFRPCRYASEPRGWQYADWRGRLYRKGLAQAHWLEDHAAHFQTVEVNGALYRLPEESTFARWPDITSKVSERARG
jgi:hypothetical protein